MTPNDSTPVPGSIGGMNAGGKGSGQITPGYPNGSPNGMSANDMQPPNMPVAPSQSSNSSIVPGMSANSTEGVPGDKNAGKSIGGNYACSSGSC